MPSAVLPDEGLADQLAYVLSAPIVGVLPWTLILWVNDLVPDHSTVLGDLVEATWPGYHRYVLDRSEWTVPVVSQGCVASTWGTVPLSWTVGVVAAPTINYGAAYVDLGSGVLRWVQRFDNADLNPLVSGSQWRLLPQYTLTSAACPVRTFRRPRGRRRSTQR
jgi:hypothetical protein